MNQEQSRPNVNELVASAETAVREQAAKTAAIAATQAQPSRLQEVVLATLLLVFAGSAYVQYPKFLAPFGTLDPSKDSAVAEADLSIIAGLVETYRASQGTYPSSLAQIHMPDVVESFVAEQKIAYRVTDKSYTLEWTLPQARLVYNGDSDTVTSDKARTIPAEK